MVTKVVVQHLRKQIEKPPFDDVVLQDPPQEIKTEALLYLIISGISFCDAENVYLTKRHRL